MNACQEEENEKGETQEKREEEQRKQKRASNDAEEGETAVRLLHSDVVQGPHSNFGQTLYNNSSCNKGPSGSVDKVSNS